MRILMLCHSFNSLSQRAFIELRRHGHQVSVEFDIHDDVTEEAVRLFQPDLIVAPFLKRAIPRSVWSAVRCLIVHPGIPGDRGPSSLDWAILNGESRWGVSIIEATGELDGGPLWADEAFNMRADASKSSLYREEVTNAAVRALNTAIERIQSGTYVPRQVSYSDPNVRGRARPAMRQADRNIDWDADDTATMLRKIRSADGNPGVLTELHGIKVYVFDAHMEGGTHAGSPGTIIAKRLGAVLVRTRDGAIWVGHARRAEEAGALKLPATMVLADQARDVPELPYSSYATESSTYRDLWYEEQDSVGYVYFPFYNGAMSTEQCERLCEVLQYARSRPARVIALMGGADFWSNGIHLHAIEASGQPADASWQNINAIDDVVLEILSATSQITVSAMRGNAGAGGVFLALAADRVHARDGIVLNPHYKGMGNLYGSEYWTYLLPKRIGAEAAQRLTQQRLPIDARGAVDIGLVDELVTGDAVTSLAAIKATCTALASDTLFEQRIAEKRAAALAREAAKPLAAYRAEELERMSLNFYGFDPSYHVARYNFVFRVPRSRTPPYLAAHRRMVAISSTKMTELSS